MLQNFPTTQAYNPGGLRSFKFAHISWFVSFPGIFDGKITIAPTFKAGLGWLNGYSTAEKLIFSEKGQNSANGPYFEKEISGFMPGFNDALVNLFGQMEGHQFVLLVTDATGKKYLAGAYTDQLLFTGNYNSGSARADLKGFNFSFTGNGLYKSPIYAV